MPAHGPGATALGRQHALSDRDLLVPGGQLGRRGVLAAAVRGPGALGELQAALVTVAGVDCPVAAGLAAGYLVPFAVGGRGRLAGEGDAAATQHRPGNGDLGDADVGSSWAYGDVHSYAREDSSLVTRLRGQLSGSGGRGYPASRRIRVGADADFTPRSRKRLQSDHGGPVGPPSPSTNWCSPAYWMELGAIGEGRYATGLLGEPPETLAVSVGPVTSYETRRFPYGHLRKPQEHKGVCAGHTVRNRSVSAPLSFRYVRYLTVSSASERRQHVDGVAGAQRCGLVANGDAVAQVRAPVQHVGEASHRARRGLSTSSATVVPGRSTWFPNRHRRPPARRRSSGPSPGSRRPDPRASHRSRSSGGRAGRSRGR